METELRVQSSDRQSKEKQRRNLIIFGVILLVLIIIIIIVIVAVEAGKDEQDSPNIEIPGNNTSNDTDGWVLPIPGQPYEYWYKGQLQNMTVNENVLWYQNETTISCIIEYDENGELDSTLSYIQILDDFAGRYKVGSIIVATSLTFAELDTNCTTFPAVIVTDIVNDTDNGILTLGIKEAEMFDYLDEIDCNITNGTLFDAGVDIGELKHIKNLESYFSNATTKIYPNGTNTTVIFSNVTYTELELLCYNLSENGTILNNITVDSNGLCAGMSNIDYFGTQYGFDEIQFGNNTFGQNGTNFSIPTDIFDVEYEDYQGQEVSTRRRLRRRRRRRFGRFFRKIVKKVKKVIKVIKEVVETIIDILKGDINKRIFEVALVIDSSKTFQVSGDKQIDDGALSGSVDGTFSINSGVDFYTGIYADFIAKYKIFTKNPSFDLFMLKIGGETRFKAFVEINVDGSIDIKIEIARTEQRKIFMLGPIPVVIKPYASISVGFEASSSITFSAEWGYQPIFMEYGIQWTPNNGWESISNKQLEFIPYKNFGGDMGDSCIDFVVTPYIEIQLGVVFYEIVDVSIIPIISIITSLQFPATCDNIDACLQQPLQTRFNMEFAFNIEIGLSVGAGSIGLPTIDKRFPLPAIDIPTITVFDTCFDTDLPLLETLCCPNIIQTTPFNQTIQQP